MTLTRFIVAGCFVMASLFTSSVNAQFSDNFDSYSNGQDLQGVNGWKGWDDSGAFSALVTNTFALSAPNSVAIAPTSDLVNELGNPTSGCWQVTIDQWVPAAMTGDQYFIMLNTYNDGLGEKNWSVQMLFSGLGGTQSGEVADAHDGTIGGAFPITTPLLFDQWVQIKMVIDLTNNTLSQYYNGEFFRGSGWSGRPGFAASGTGQLGLSIGAVDLFSAGASEIYYDNFVMESITCPPANPLITVTPTRGDHVAGGIPELEGSDNGDYQMRRRQADTQSRTEFEVQSFVNIDPTTITSFELTLEGAVFARSNVIQTIEMYDYAAQAWDEVDSQDAARSPAADLVVTAPGTGDLSRYVEFDRNGDDSELDTWNIRARIRYQSESAPRQNFASNTDNVFWTIEN